jgi:hypothetical protein
MATITLKYDARNPLIKSILNSAILAGAKVEDEKQASPYNKEFVKKIRKSEKQPGVKMDLENLWK